MDYETAKQHLIEGLTAAARRDEGEEAAKNVAAVAVVVSTALDALKELAEWARKQNART